MHNIPTWQRIVNGSVASLRSAMGIGSNTEGFSRRAMIAIKWQIPYVIHSVPDGKSMIWLNREYKPVGYSPSQFVHYAQHAHVLMPRDHPLLHFARVYLDSYDLGTLEVRHYFFGDGNAPWYSAANARRYLGLLEPFADLRDIYGA